MLIAQIIGTIAFTISGASIAYEKKCDIFGVVILGFVCAFGGGIIRDILLGINPPAIFFEMFFINISLVTSVGLYITYKQLGKFNKVIYEYVLNIIDAIGLGIFTCIACNIVLQQPKNNIYMFMAIAFITSCGGGICRDLLVRRIPVIFKKDIYALSTIFGAVAYYILINLSMQQKLIIVVTFSLVFTIRLIVYHYKLSLK